MREGVTVRNSKTDSNSKFGCLNTAEERERCVGEASMAEGHGLATPWGGRVTHGQTTPLVPWATCTPHGKRVMWSCLIGCVSCVLDLNMILFDSLLSSGHFGYSFI